MGRYRFVRIITGSGQTPVQPCEVLENGRRRHAGRACGSCPEHSENRIQLIGLLLGQVGDEESAHVALVLRGTEQTAGGAVDVAVTWQPDGATVRQVWEVSRDGGTTWEETATLIYAPQ